MNIEIDEEYTLAPNDVCPDKWDIIQKVERNKKTAEGQPKESYEGENNLAYAVSLDYALKILMGKKMSQKKETVNLKEYLHEYKKEKQQLEELLKQVLSIKLSK